MHQLLFQISSKCDPGIGFKLDQCKLAFIGETKGRQARLEHAGSPYLRERLSTVDHLIKVAYFVKKVMFAIAKAGDLE